MSNAIDFDVSMNFVPRAYRPAKPRTIGMTEVRAPYYSTFGTRHRPRWLAIVVNVNKPGFDSRRLRAFRTRAIVAYLCSDWPHFD